MFVQGWSWTLALEVWKPLIKACFYVPWRKLNRFGKIRLLKNNYFKVCPSQTFEFLQGRWHWTWGFAVPLLEAFLEIPLAFACLARSPCPASGLLHPEPNTVAYSDQPDGNKSNTHKNNSHTIFSPLLNAWYIRERENYLSTPNDVQQSSRGPTQNIAALQHLSNSVSSIYTAIHHHRTHTGPTRFKTNCLRIFNFCTTFNLGTTSNIDWMRDFMRAQVWTMLISTCKSKSTHEICINTQPHCANCTVVVS